MPDPGEEMLTLSQQDRDRLVVLREVGDGLVTARRGAELVGLTPRQFRRLRREWERRGDEAVMHGLRGQRSNRAKSTQVRERAMKRARAAVFKGFGPTLLAEHLSRDHRIGELKGCTLRLWMIEEGLWKPKRRRARHRKARPRRAAFGELIQWDSSDHAWFEDRFPGRFVLIQMHAPTTLEPPTGRSRSTTYAAMAVLWPSTPTRRATSASGSGRFPLSRLKSGMQNARTPSFAGP
jgi:hypothetical protein